MIWYVDYESGTDANASAGNGDSYATRRKTLTNMVAAAIAPGDEIRIKASPEPSSLGQNATWTDGPLPATFVPGSSTNTSPIVFTKAGHGLVTGDTVIVQAHTTNTNANGVWDVTVDGDTFTLLNADGSNSVGNGVGGATGTVRKITNSVVKLTTPITQNIACFGNQNSAGRVPWTPSANVTSTIHATDYKEGYGSQSTVIAVGFTTGLAAYFPTGLLDLSAYQQISFWVKQTVGTLGLDASCSLTLCSDAAGTVVVDTINIPKLGALNSWSPITVDLVHALGSSIQSIGFVVNTDNGAQTFLIDNIIACKASSAANSLNNTSLIGKNTGIEGWYGLQSINGTRVILDMYPSCVPKTSPSRGYSGTTETVTTWKRETTKTVMATTYTTQVQTINDSGTAENLIIFSGGWNRTDMSTLTGDTFFDGQNGLGHGIYIGNSTYTTLYISGCRYFELVYYSAGNNNTANIANASNSAYGVFLNSPSNLTALNGVNLNNNLMNGANYNGSTVGGYIATITNANNNGGIGVALISSDSIMGIINANNNGNIGLSIGGKTNTIDITNANGNSSNGIYLDAAYNTIINVTNANGNSSDGISLNSSNNTIINVTNANNNTGSGIKYNTSYNNIANILSSSGNIISSINNNSFGNILRNSTLGSTVKVSGAIGYYNYFLWSTNENGNSDTHFGYTDGGLISSDVTTVHTAGGMSWKLSPTSTTRSANYPLPLKVAVGATAANTPITCKVWVRRDNIGLTARLICKGGQLLGADNDVMTYMTAEADVWELLSVSVTPTQKGVLEFTAECWGGTAYNCWTEFESFS